MIKRTDEEVQAYVDGYNACFEKFRETLLQRNVGADKAIRKMETLKEAVNSVLLTENVGMCQQNVGEMSEKQTDENLISRQAVIDIVEFECGEWKGLAKTIVKAIKDVPSAEKTTINYEKTTITDGDLISRQAVIDGINVYIEKAQSTGAIDDFISFEELVVKALPSAEKTAEWKPLDKEKAQYYMFGYVCSKCGAPAKSPTKYCSNCGAKICMEEIKDET